MSRHRPERLPPRSAWCLTPCPAPRPAPRPAACLAFCFAALLAASHGQAQQPSPASLAVAPIRWAEAGAANEDRVVNGDLGTPLRYRVRKIDGRGETVRVVIESKDGSVARLIEHNGQPLTADENTAERGRLQAILDSPDAYLRHVRREQGSRTYATELLRSFPKAMLWSYVPGQPQLPAAQGPAVVLDFKPDPSFKPTSLVAEGLTGVAGRVWVDEQTHCPTRIEAGILSSVNFGWGGVLARVKEGGRIEFDQRKITDRRWLYSHVSEHLTVREVLVHTTQENSEATVSDVQPLPAPLSVREAVQTLLAMPVTTR